MNQPHFSQRRFSLQPFPKKESAPKDVSSLSITGAIARRAATLTLHYELCGAIATLKIPPPATQPSRQNGLWQTTCFECFLAVKGTTQYWEINLSPAGHWNVYRFSAYRQGMQPELAWSSLPVCVQRNVQSAAPKPDRQPETETLQLDLELNLTAIVSPEQSLEIGISAVVQQQDGTITYWALNHPGPEADFHQRDSFTLDL